MKITSKRKRFKSDLPISGETFKHGLFLESFERIFQPIRDDPDLLWDARDSFERLGVLTKCIRKAGKLTRDAISKIDPSGNFGRLKCLSAVSRAVFEQDRERAELLLYSHPGAGFTIQVSEYVGKVCLPPLSLAFPKYLPTRASAEHVSGSVNGRPSQSVAARTCEEQDCKWQQSLRRRCLCLKVLET